ncbi:hypothetical protein [Mucilaginibacter paludis]|uniref:Uncharacterized protein n=1 Tax=Mucilaginibacter paludis DSM 18603 TaxID=714943 RepID=H1YH73_9SPHI|nr:hypothetical protein [Mucilaginibacter paludis]EHQ24575.1 hypothetical protein Mucpa_0379 [Mucilaginibacter paludis DSM 18603]
MHCFESKEIIKIFFDELINYDNAEELFERFEANLNANLIEKIDGPYSRIWIISIQDVIFKLVIDEDYGSMLVGESDEAIFKAKEIYSELEKFIH